MSRIAIYCFFALVVVCSGQNQVVDLSKDEGFRKLGCTEPTCFKPPPAPLNPKCINWLQIHAFHDCESIAQNCIIPKSTLYSLNPYFVGGKKCGHLDIGTKVCCDLKGEEHEHTEGQRNQQFLAEILALSALGVSKAGLVVGALGSIGGLSNGIFNRGFTGTPCFQDNLNFGGPLLQNIASIGSSTACQIRCQLTLGCNFWTFERTNNICALLTAVTAQQAQNGYTSGPKFCSILP